MFKPKHFILDFKTSYKYQRFHLFIPCNKATLILINPKSCTEMLVICHMVYPKYLNRALDKREYWVIIRDNFCQFCRKTYAVTPHLNCLYETLQMRGHKTYVVTSHLNCLNETVQMRGHNIWFQREVRKIILYLSSNSPLIYSSHLKQICTVIMTLLVHYI